MDNVFLPSNLLDRQQMLEKVSKTMFCIKTYVKEICAYVSETKLQIDANIARGLEFATVTKETYS